MDFRVYLIRVQFGHRVCAGDEHLAVFRFSKVEEESEEPEKPNEEAEA